MKKYEIEDTLGNTIASFTIDKEGNPIETNDCSFADEDPENNIRIQLEN